MGHGGLPLPTSTPIQVDVLHAPGPGVLEWFTLIAAALAALFALLLWRQAMRTTNIDIALRLLDRVDAEMHAAESHIGWLQEQGHLSSYAAWEAWHNAFNQEKRTEESNLLSRVMFTYEHIGLVLRKTNAKDVTDIVTDYLSLECPRVFDALKPIIGRTRERAGSHAGADFEWLAERCRAVERQRPRAESATGSS
jgi:hypothetical protein